MPAVPIRELMKRNPAIKEFFSSMGVAECSGPLLFGDWLSGLTDEFLCDTGMTREQIAGQLERLMGKTKNSRSEKPSRLDSITVIGGRDKSGNSEGANIVFKPGEIICVVGPTGSGKSRLLADIECLAGGDTPTGRRILVNDKEPGSRYNSASGKLVAQISQNMNFVVDLSVKEFIAMRARSRMISDAKEAVRSVVGCANSLTGEKFRPDVSVTQLSGGQSRALMIADAALLSLPPVILIDEIENAGIDRKKSLELLVKKEKIVLISTHDPLLALMGTRRVAMKNGGITRVIESGAGEKKNLAYLESFDRKMAKVRDRLRRGEKIEEPLSFS